MRETNIIKIYFAFKLFQRFMDEGINEGFIKGGVRSKLEYMDRKMRPWMDAVEHGNDLGQRRIDMANFVEEGLELLEDYLDKHLEWKD